MRKKYATGYWISIMNNFKPYITKIMKKKKDYEKKIYTYLSISGFL